MGPVNISFFINFFLFENSIHVDFSWTTEKKQDKKNRAKFFGHLNHILKKYGKSERISNFGLNIITLTIKYENLSKYRQINLKIDCIFLVNSIIFELLEI